MSDVEERRASDRVCSLGPTLAWAGNYVAKNSAPRKFVYNACSHVTEGDLTYKKSLEFGRQCGHVSRGEPKFRFQVILFDAFHSGSHPLKAHIWDCAVTMLNCSALEFTTLNNASQMTAVQLVF